MRGIIGLPFYAVVALGPILAGVVIASRFLLRRDRLIGLAPLAVVIGFLAGGAVGWAFVPAQWSASFWTTVEAAGNAAKYGESFEHTAERALLYPYFFALLGAVAFGVAALVVVWRTSLPLRDPFRRIKAHTVPHKGCKPRSESEPA
jgi:MFS superfamily sulfate permease-like transporter